MEFISVMKSNGSEIIVKSTCFQDEAQYLSFTSVFQVVCTKIWLRTGASQGQREMTARSSLGKQNIGPLYREHIIKEACEGKRKLNLIEKLVFSLR